MTAEHPSGNFTEELATLDARIAADGNNASLCGIDWEPTVEYPGGDYHTLTKNISIEICSKCHPFYTGKQKLVDTSGRVDKFNKKYGIK